LCDQGFFTYNTNLVITLEDFSGLPGHLDLSEREGRQVEVVRLVQQEDAVQRALQLVLGRFNGAVNIVGDLSQSFVLFYHTLCIILLHALTYQDPILRLLFATPAL
jgi:hypothetical protein